MSQNKRGQYVPCENCPWRRSGVFRPIPPAALVALGRFKKNHIHVPARRTLVRPSGQHSVFYTLFDGWAFGYANVNGNRQILHFYVPGDVIGVQIPLLGAVTCTVQTLTDASLCVFACDKVEALFETQPRLGLEIARIAAAESMLIRMRLAAIGRREAVARVAYLLAELHARLKQRRLWQGDGCVLPLTQEHFADALGLSTVHISRMFKVLGDDGIARFERGRLTILDLQALHERAELDGGFGLAEPSLL